MIFAAWLGVDALPLGLVDEIKTSDEYLEDFVRKGIDVLIVKRREERKMRGFFKHFVSSNSYFQQVMDYGMKAFGFR